MTDIKVNKLLWDTLSETERKHIALHLRMFGVLTPDQHIVGDAETPPPKLFYKLENIVTGSEDDIEALGVDWFCRSVCDLAKKNKGCTQYGQSLSTCLATIAASREAYKVKADSN